MGGKSGIDRRRGKQRKVTQRAKEIEIEEETEIKNNEIKTEREEDIELKEQRAKKV
jgi:hypothetical protein